MNYSLEQNNFPQSQMTMTGLKDLIYREIEIIEVRVNLKSI